MQEGKEYLYFAIGIRILIVSLDLWRPEPDENKRKRVISSERVPFDIDPTGDRDRTGNRAMEEEEEGKRLDYHWRRILTATLAGHRTIYQPSWPAHTGMPHDCHYLRCHRVIYTRPFDYRVEPLAIFFRAKICRMDRGQGWKSARVLVFLGWFLWT